MSRHGTSTLTPERVAAAEKQGREAIAANQTGGQYDALQEARQSADRQSIQAHEDTAEADASKDPHKHLDAARSHLRAAEKHGGVAGFLGQRGDKKGADESSGRADGHRKLAKRHATEAANCVQ